MYSERYIHVSISKAKKKIGIITNCYKEYKGLELTRIYFLPGICGKNCVDSQVDKIRNNLNKLTGTQAGTISMGT